MARKRKWVRFSKEFNLDKTEVVFAELRSYLKEFDIDFDTLEDSKAVTFSVFYKKISGGGGSYSCSLEGIEEALMKSRDSGYYGNIDFKVKIEINLEKLAELNQSEK